MGGDGGSIPGRADIVKVKGYTYKRNLGGMGYEPNTLVNVAVDRGNGDDEIDNLMRCALSKELLRPPILMDKTGRPYIKENVLAMLLDKTLKHQFKEQYGIKSLSRDLTELHSAGEPPFPVFDQRSLQCQLSAKPYNEKTKQAFCLSWRCGCLFTHKAALEIKGASLKPVDTCPVCDCPDTEILTFSL